jgi:hypothetical protein
MLADIRQELRSLKKRDLTVAELQATLDDISARIADVLANHLVAVGPSRPTQETTTAATTAPETTTTAPTTTEVTTTTESTTTTTGVTTTSGP